MCVYRDKSTIHNSRVYTPSIRSATYMVARNHGLKYNGMKAHVVYVICRLMSDAINDTSCPSKMVGWIKEWKMCMTMCGMNQSGEWYRRIGCDLNVMKESAVRIRENLGETRRSSPLAYSFPSLADLTSS